MELYESSRQTPYYRNASDEIETAYHQRFLDETDGRTFDPPEQCDCCGRWLDPSALEAATHPDSGETFAICRDRAACRVYVATA